jgi:uncharacterized protein YfiM (DUF2279 family)
MKNRIVAVIIAIILFSFCSKTIIAQDTLSFWSKAPEYKKSRGVILGASLGSAYVLSMAGLYSLWYKDYPASNFHFFNDNGEWLQMDKFGHFGSAYYLGKWGMDLFSWTGMERKKAVLYGGSVGFVFLTTIEIFDGFSEQWGFSTGDMIANTAGTSMAIAQELLWDEQRIKVKFSFHQTDYPNYRSDLLGENYTENLFKDYNGQTYWLSGNIKSFIHRESKFPTWLNFAIGYGAEGMTGANKNIELAGVEKFERYRQFYIAPDIDLTKIKTRNKTLKVVFGVLGFIKVPTPTLEFNGNGKTKLYWLYF